ncbi:hypothetical protein B0T21DRAFT_352362 [Apiosordaria backusii]|uniref:Uncharacterized protein n=1 Tax=Apiosordaria backusii TaxID=314023 RepID=A0AA40AEL4_9PEZI|nr:hypothetical protein B0T21DRAFT_352362 [Apiosordaria backusii]
MKSARDRFKRVVHIGGASLSSLLLGSLILLFVGFNTRLSVPQPEPFKTGSHLPVQFWLAVLGAGFSLLAYGLSESYIHIFDVWCTWQADSESGLDYSRYLNTQPRAPVVFGLRGFRGFVLARYMVVGLGVIGSVGYKFAIVEIAGASLELDETALTVSFPSSEPILLQSGTTSAWIHDSPGLDTSQAFLHYNYLYEWPKDILVGDLDPLQPPRRIFMAGEADCGSTFHALDEGVLVTLELVMVASISAEKGDEEEFIEPEPRGWTRTAKNGAGWGTPKDVVMEYMNGRNGILRVRWAEVTDWLDKDRGALATKQPITRSITYNIGFALAEVSRNVSSKGCWKLKSVLQLSGMSGIYQDPPPLQYESWLNMIIKDDNTTILDGVAVIVRHSLTSWGIHVSNATGYTLGHAPTPSKPWYWSRLTLRPDHRDESTRHKGPWTFSSWLELSSGSTDGVITDLTFPQAYFWRDKNVGLKYPYYKGTSVSYAGVGCYPVASVIFIALAVLGYSLFLLRIFLGPAGLTSWMGQHVYLALEGKIQKDGSERLACGHKVAQDLGTVKITWAPRKESRRDRPEVNVQSDSGKYLGVFVNGL